MRMLKESCQPDAVAWLKGGIFPLVFMFQAAVKMKFLSSSCGDFALRAAVATGERRPGDARHSPGGRPGNRVGHLDIGTSSA